MMSESNIRSFLCDNIDKALIRGEWEKWLRSLELYLASEDITDFAKKRNKLLHLGGAQLQEVAYNIPGAIETYNDKENNDVFKILVEKLTDYFSPKQNSTFERHLFRSLKPEQSESFNKFVLRVRHQATKCSFGNSAQEALEINVKDKIIDSWAPTELKKKLLEKERSLDEIIEVCNVHEQIGNQSKAMDSITAGPSTSFAINKIQSSNKNNSNQCTRCGKFRHLNKDCPAIGTKCHKCGFIGHYAFMCKTRIGTKRFSNNTTPSYQSHNKRRRPGSKINFIEGENEETEQTEAIRDFECFKISGHYKEENNDDLIECSLGGVPVTLLIDSGSTVNIVKGDDWKILTKQNAVLWDIDPQPQHNLKGYASGKPLDVRHTFQSTIALQAGEEIITSFYVVDQGDISILGKDTAKQLGILKLGININQIEMSKPFPKIKNIKIKLTIDPHVKPVRQPVRRVPISVEKQVEKKLEEALLSDIIEKVTEPSAWISPIVIIFKPNDDIRICVDMRRANEAIIRENYPLPTFESFMTKLRDAKYFSRLDLTNAYHQLELDEESRPITTFISHKGMFRYKRLMFGVNSAPEIFQRVFEEMLSSCRNCLNYLDDVIIYGSTEFEHDICLKKVLDVFSTNNVLLNEAKCVKKVQELYFLGHKLSSKGIEADQLKIQTVLDFRPPRTKEETRSFLGLVTYLGKFIPDLGTTTEPLRQLTRENQSFDWSKAQQESFEKLKDLLASLPTLSYFDPKLRTRLVADASPVALGAVLLQFNKKEEPQVISFASKSLSSVERRYSQTEKESLALVWAVERFYYYLSGLEFELVTDHKPLEAIFKPSSKPPARIERWVLRLQSFKFKIVYQSGKQNIADSLSRLCQIKNEPPFDKENEHHIFTVIERNSPQAIKISQVVAESQLDGQITEAVNKINKECWEPTDKNIFYPFRLELTTVGHVILRGNRLVIPESLREQVLRLAHEGHPGETVMKRRLRAKVWWPLIDKAAEKFVKNCRDCLLVSLPDKPPPMTRHKFPEGPWQCVAIDLMGPLPNHEQLLVIVDYYSRYQEIIFLKSTTSSVIINHLTEIFSRLGIPRSIRADNGPQFTSQEFKNFCLHNNIDLIHTPPYWPQANGEVENMNRAILKRLQISHTNKLNYKTELHKFTMMYNATPHGTTGKAPSELLFNRIIRDKLPSVADLVNEPGDEEAYDNDLLNKNKGKEKEDKARHAKIMDIREGDKVLIQNMIIPHKLTTRFNNEEFTVIERKGNEATLSGQDGQILKRHVSHLKKLTEPSMKDKHDKMRNVITQSSIPNPLSTDPSTAQLTGPNKEPTASDKLPPLKLKKMEGLWQCVE